MFVRTSFRRCLKMRSFSKSNLLNDVRKFQRILVCWLRSVEQWGMKPRDFQLCLMIMLMYLHEFIS